MSPGYWAYWGKAAQAEEQKTAVYHLLPYHCLDVAAVASQWWDSSAAIRASFCRVTGLSQSQTKAWVLFFIALHDLGKLDVRFQLKVPEALKVLWPDFGEDDANSERGYYHGPQGYLAFRKQISRKLGFGLDSAKDWLAAVCGHHGDLQMSGQWQTPDAEEWVIERDEEARLTWANTLVDLFLRPAQIDYRAPLPDCPPMLAGFCSVCDWIGSNSDFFTFQPKPYEDGLEAYWAKARKIASPLIEKFGLHKQGLGITGMEGLFPKLRPRQLQTIVQKLNSAPGLTVIEAPTGSGKTEAALAYASELLSKSRADSVIFALPTQATANAMLERLEEVANRLYADGANLVLAHGKARFNHEFQRVKSAAERSDAQGKEAAQVQCAKWLGESRKRVFLGQIGVCTIDQVLISVLPVRHNFVRSFGVQKSVLIVDEVHAYDAYMYGLLTKVLENQSRAGGSAILLSATLPAAHKVKLIEAWAKNVGPVIDEQTTYPLVTQVCGEDINYLEIEDKTQLPKPREVHIELVATEDCLPDEDLINRIIDAASKGALVGMVCNLVADAQRLYQTIAARVEERGVEIPVDIFHARYIYADRQLHEQRVKDHYGKDADRDLGRILVATQVIEQSLDLDFDWLITQICPVDLLFQRLGRLHRHERDNRASVFASASRAVVLVPTDEEDFGLHQVIYASARLLWRTRQLLRGSEKIRFPQAYRHWIEQVYSEAPWSDEPDSVVQSHEAYEQKSEASYYVARQLSSANYNPSSDTDENVACMTRDGDMNANLLLLQESPQGLQTLSGERLAELDEWQQQETMMLNTVGVPASWKKWLPEALTKDNDVAELIGVMRNGHWECREGAVLLTYDSKLGLVRREE